MKFIDHAKIYVKAGNGGRGCLSFRREKFIPFGGPDGGDGGDGGSIFLQGDASLNTLINFQYQRHYKAQNGQPGAGAQCRGRSGEDVYVPVPLGTSIYDAMTDELIGEIMHHEQSVKVAQGGFHGMGNLRFKTSTNRAPRKITLGSPGDERELYLELKVLADVGLLGYPNAGKSTLISAISAAHPKVADYPFTTLHPYLGVVRVGIDRSFVVADLPGIIEGAAEGAGLGAQFLKHATRTKILLHIVDLCPVDEIDPVVTAKALLEEVKAYSEELYEKPRWLVLNKIDLLPEAEREKTVKSFIRAFKWKGPVYAISGVAKLGLEKLTQDLSEALMAMTTS